MPTLKSMGYDKDPPCCRSCRYRGLELRRAKSTYMEQRTGICLLANERVTKNAVCDNWTSHKGEVLEN